MKRKFVILANNKLSQFWSKVDKINISVIRIIEFHNKKSISEKKWQNLVTSCARARTVRRRTLLPK